MTYLITKTYLLCLIRIIIVIMQIFGAYVKRKKRQKTNSTTCNAKEISDQKGHCTGDHHHPGSDTLCRFTNGLHQIISR
jgi:hypothetical protein